jgi:tetratricopeptide (TPR) repeat protein
MSYFARVLIAAVLLAANPVHADAETIRLTPCQYTTLMKLGEYFRFRPELQKELMAYAVEDGRLKNGDFRLEEAKCLFQAKKYDDALATLVPLEKSLGYGETNDSTLRAPLADVYYQLALTYEKLNRPKDAASAISSAHSFDKDSELYAEEYKRLAPDAYSMDLERAKMDLKRAKEEELAFWARSSADQRRVLASHGGFKEDNAGSRPCHVETFQTKGRSAVTWWYCDSKGRYEQAYMFVNGKLESKYKP